MASVNYGHSLESLITSSRSFARVSARSESMCSMFTSFDCSTAISLRSADSFVMGELIAYYEHFVFHFCGRNIFSSVSPDVPTDARSRRSNDFVVYSRLHHSSRNRSSLLNHLSAPPSTCKFTRAQVLTASSRKRGDGKAGEKRLA